MTDRHYRQRLRRRHRPSFDWLHRSCRSASDRYYHLDPNDRYVYSNGYIYVVDPTTYAVTRVIDTDRR